MIHYSTGDMFKSGAEALVCPVNLVGTMGKGLALTFKKKFPWCVEPYESAVKERRFGIGQVICAPHPLQTLCVLHVATKVHWRDPSELFYVTSGLIALQKWLMYSKVSVVAVPALGCGLGGISWDIVKPEIERYLGDAKQRVVVYSPK